MLLEHYPVEQFKTEIINILKRYINITEFKIFFFGSRVDGSGDECSDIDIGLEGREIIKQQVLTRIRHDIENIPVLYKIDIVDFNNVSEDFKKVALKKIELIT